MNPYVFTPLELALIEALKLCSVAMYPSCEAEEWEAAQLAAETTLSAVAARQQENLQTLSQL